VPDDLAPASTAPAGELLRVHLGSSMVPTLCERDLLEVEPYRDRAIQVGDVILFTPAGEEHAIVHRLVGVGPEGLRTRGDNNREVDAWQLQPTEVEGQVVAARRGRRRRRVAGGVAGRATGWLASIRRRLLGALTPLLGPPYRGLADRGLVSRVLPGRLRPRPRVVEFQGPSGLEAHLLLGGRRIGRFDPTRGRWVVDRPYRLLVDERSLARPGARPG